MTGYCKVVDGVLTHASDCELGYPSGTVVDGNLKNERGRAKAQVQLVPPALVIWTSDAMADGARKYGPYNWREGRVEIMQYLAACQRHLLAYQDGQEAALDSGIHHLAHAAATLAIVMDALECGVAVDDRPKEGPAGSMLGVRAWLA